MRKAIITITVLGIIIIAVAAFAHGNNIRPGYFGRGCSNSGHEYMESKGYRMEHGHMTRSQTRHMDDMKRFEYCTDRNHRRVIPSEIVEKMNMIEKLHHQMRLEFLEQNPDKDKLMAFHNRMQDLRRKISDWHFREYLDRFDFKPSEGQQ